MIRAALLLAVATPLLPVSAQDQDPPSSLTVAGVVGRYEYRDKELVGYLDLHPDGSFEYRVDGIGPPVEGEGRFLLFYTGRWRFVGYDGILLSNAPTTPPVFQQTSAVRDDTVRAALTIVPTDGEPTYDVGLLTDDGENGQLNMLSDGSWVIPLLHPWDTDDGPKGSPARLPRKWEIIRSSDDLSLATIALSPTGPNRFTFRYTPSPIQPFRLGARPVEDEPGMMEVEFGTASVKMRRTR